MHQVPHVGVTKINLISGLESSFSYLSYPKPAKVTRSACFLILDKEVLKSEFRSTFGVMSATTN